MTDPLFWLEVPEKSAVRSRIEAALRALGKEAVVHVGDAV